MPRTARPAVLMAWWRDVRGKQQPTVAPTAHIAIAVPSFKGGHLALLTFSFLLAKPRQVRQGLNLAASCKEEVRVSAPTIQQGALPRVRQAVQQLLPPLRAAR